jgi:uncharacterized protein YjeT (DUF2065 family)
MVEADLPCIRQARSAHVQSYMHFFGVFLLVEGLPYFLLWRSYKKAFVSFVSPEDEVSVSGARAAWPRIFAIAAGAALILLGLGVFLVFAVSHKP